MRTLAVPSSAALALLAAPLAAQSFNLDLQPPESPQGVPSSAYGAAAGQVGLWETVDTGQQTDCAAAGAVGAGGATDLRDISGSVTPVALDLNLLAFWDGDTGASGSGDGAALMKDSAVLCLYNFDITFTNLLPGEYLVYTYIANTLTSLVGEDVTIDGVTHHVQGVFNGAHVQGQDFCLHDVTVDESGTIVATILIFKIHDYASLNGFQLVRLDDVGSLLCQGDGTGPAACPCGNDSAVPGRGCVHSGGEGIRLWTQGTASLAADDLTLIADHCPPGNTGIFYVGESNLWPGVPLYDGLQCAGGNARRFQGQFQSDGVASDTGFVAQEPTGTYFVAGQTYVYQYFSRDFAAGSSPCGLLANFSPGLRVVYAP